jgi:hypothetical protein
MPSSKRTSSSASPTTASSTPAGPRHFGATPNATFTPGVGGAAAGPTTTNNDDTCDISTAPAATLLLPYFAVDTRAGGQTTLFTITNVSRFPQIAHVTVWSEYSVPVLDFNIFLTGYDVQGINLYDLLQRGIVAPDAAPAGDNGFTSSGSTPGAYSLDNDANPNFGAGAEAACTTLPGNLPSTVVAAYQTALSTGLWTCGASHPVGGNHPGTYIGYVTVDVANTCSINLPDNPTYFNTELLYDNVLIGDYQQLGPAPAGQVATSFDGAGNPMVHIRAIPEGGPAGSSAVVGTNLPFTFYDRYTPAGDRTADRRQPLPSAFAARWIETGTYATNYKIWREGTGTDACTSASTANYTLNYVSEIVRFDDAENPSTVTANNPICSPNCGGTATYLPETSLTGTTNVAQYTGFSTGGQLYPDNTTGDTGGWMYMNLSNGGSTNYSVTSGGTIISGATAYSNLQNPGLGIGFTNSVGPTTLVGPRPSQNWVVIEMFSSPATGNRLTADWDAAWLGNGCSPAFPASVVGGTSTIGPATQPQGDLVCPDALVALDECPSGEDATNTTPLP